MTLLRRFARYAAMLVCCMVLAGCASVPIEELLASTDIVKEFPRASGPLVEVARFSAGRAGEAPPDRWEPFIVSRSAALTEYRLVEADSNVVLDAQADSSVSGLYRRIRIDPTRHPIVEWRWRVVQPPAGVDPRVPSREDSPARLVISFHGDVARLDFFDRSMLRLYTALSGEKLPFAILMYTWSSNAPIGTIASNIHNEQIRMIVVDSGHAGEWREFRRNVLEDYRLAFGEDPWDVVAVGVMTDTRYTGQKARAQYGDISFRSAQ